MSITIKQMCNKMNDNCRTNFVGRCITLLQANGIDMCLKQFENYGIDLEGYILLISHPQTGRKVSKESFINTKSNILTLNYEYESISTFTRIRAMIYALYSSIFNKNKRVIYIAWTKVLYEWIYYFEKYVKDSQVRFVIIDDGGGSYADIFKDMLNFEVCNHPERSYLKSVVKIWFRSLYFKLLFTNLNCHGRIKDNRLFKIQLKKNRWNFERNEEVIDYYLEVLRERIIDIEEDVLNTFSSAIVINTQCYYENNITDGVVDLEAYDKAIEELRSISDIRILLKPHPRELNIEKYHNLNCDLYCDNRYPQEAIFANVDVSPYCVISIDSSTLLNSYGIFSIPSISLAKILLNDKTLRLKKMFVDELEQFVDRYKEIILMPEDYSELKSMVGEIIDTRKKMDVNGQRQ